MKKILTLTTNRTVQEQKEVSLPAYLKIEDYFYYCIYSNESCIQVNAGNNRPSIETVHATLPFEISKPPIEITKEEFEKAYHKVSAQLNAIILSDLEFELSENNS